MVPLLAWQATFIVAFSIFILYWSHPDLSFKRLGDAVTRLRWLFFSLIIIYFWFTPGDPVFGWQTWIMPTNQGVRLAAERMLIMTIMISVVYATLWITPIKDIQFGILDTLDIAHFPRVFSRKLALRLAACLDAAPAMLRELSSWKQTEKTSSKDSQSPFRLLARTLDRAEMLQLIPEVETSGKLPQTWESVSRLQLVIPVSLLGLLLYMMMVFR